MHCYLIGDANEWVNGISTVPYNSPAILHLWERAYSVGGKEVPFVLSLVLPYWSVIFGTVFRLITKRKIG